MKRFIIFLRDVVLGECDEQVAIFIDEIDSALHLDFSDDFFAAIRSIYNARAQEPSFERLTFVLLGTATPSDLIKEHTRTPFNIGEPLLLPDFTFSEAKVLQDGLEKSYLGQGETILKQIYDLSVDEWSSLPHAPQSSLQNQLKLSGLVKAQDGYLQVRNNIYRTVFNSAWIKTHTTIDWTPVIAVTALVVMLFLFSLLLSGVVG